MPARKKTAAPKAKKEYKPYFEKLRDPQWQRKRLVIMERDKFSCRDCRTTTVTLNVHHLYYEKGKDPWDYPDSTLITLCEPCHEKAEHQTREILAMLSSRWTRSSVLRYLRFDNTPSRVPGLLPEAHFAIGAVIQFAEASAGLMVMMKTEPTDQEQVDILSNNVDYWALQVSKNIGSALAKIEEGE